VGSILTTSRPDRGLQAAGPARRHLENKSRTEALNEDRFRVLQQRTTEWQKENKKKKMNIDKLI